METVGPGPKRPRPGRLDDSYDGPSGLTRTRRSTVNTSSQRRAVAVGHRQSLVSSLGIVVGVTERLIVGPPGVPICVVADHGPLAPPGQLCTQRYTFRAVVGLRRPWEPHAANGDWRAALDAWYEDRLALETSYETAARQQLVKLDPGQRDSGWWHQQQRENRCRHHEVTNDGTIRTCAV